MSRSFIYLRRALFGASCTIVFGFGATQAMANPDLAREGRCMLTGYAYMPPVGVCPEDYCGNGYCDGHSTECVC